MSQTELEKSPYAVLDVVNCTSANLRKVNRLVTQVYDASLRPVGLRATQFNLIATLVKLGDTPLSRLAGVLVMDRTTLTRNLKPLVDKGLIRIDHEEDQRIRIISLTDEGKIVFEEALPFWREAQSQLVEGLGQNRWSAFLDDLRAMIDVVQRE
ncbi:MarR family winged helix-turn-helix transcriptional regulator [uncultured Marinobacter sp.]|uniref:MarR family winged helix-turn-helix transcriptional regulator n=1 Tax=uncultured Marinobacter sp. TaxID=187379 RepID=UPI0030D8811E|tara:strand:+ start:8840 stop:9301 length:462 start_codon:yes stop_codon:yes gene_type:complete